MVSLEQVKLLESKVTRAIDYLKKVTDENTQLKEKLDSYQKRIDDLEILIQRFKEDQSRIEDGILSALDRLNQFEDALESTLSNESTLSTESTLSDESITPDKVKPKQADNNSRSSLDLEGPSEEEKNSGNGELDIF